MKTIKEEIHVVAKMLENAFILKGSEASKRAMWEAIKRMKDGPAKKKLLRNSSRLLNHH